MAVKHDRADLIHRGLNGLNLLDHIDTIGILADHSLDALDMPGCACQSLAYRILRRFIQHDLNPLGTIDPPPGGRGKSIVTMSRFLSIGSRTLPQKKECGIECAKEDDGLVVYVLLIPSS
jgi:hypothetical protein